MTRWGQILRKLAMLVRRDKFNRDLAEEMQSHMAMEAEENQRNGMSAEEARYATIRKRHAFA